ncbi:MAG: YceI family protein [Kofleriaceae bacterium]|nr:YceI family protein [Kofleriaceae bacterium]
MKLHNLLTSTCLAAVLAVAPSCKKKEDKAPQPTPTATTNGSNAEGSATAPGSAAGSAVAPTPVPDESADHITVLARHKNPKPNDPIRLNFEKFKVVKADFDPKKIEGGTASIEIDLSSFHTDSDKRDEHVKSASYLDVSKLATATVTIDNVKQKAGSSYTADATVAAHGTTKKYPVTFDVLETKDDSIKIKGEHTFPRMDFAIGTDPAQNADESVAPEVTIEMVLTLAKT